MTALPSTENIHSTIVSYDIIMPLARDHGGFTFSYFFNEATGHITSDHSGVVCKDAPSAPMELKQLGSVGQPCWHGALYEFYGERPAYGNKYFD
jgi:hypothetical protein